MKYYKNYNKIKAKEIKTVIISQKFSSTCNTNRDAKFRIKIELQGDDREHEIRNKRTQEK